MTIVVLGAGDIGAAATRQLAAADVASRLVLVDEAGTVAAGKALDIAQAAPVDGYHTRLSGTTDLTAVTGAGVVIVADRVGEGEWSGETGLALIRRIAGYNASAPILLAGAAQADLVDRGTQELGLPRTRLFGTAPEALRAAVVALVSLDAELSPAAVSLTVVGRAPAEIIVPWESVSLDGRRAVDVLPPPVLTRLDGRLSRLWPPGPTALGGAAARVVGSMITRAPRVHAIQVALSRDEGPSARSAMLPARVHPHGILRVEPPPLSSRDRVRLDTALAR